jgi:hypothetical protein
MPEDDLETHTATVVCHGRRISIAEAHRNRVAPSSIFENHKPVTGWVEVFYYRTVLHAHPSIERRLKLASAACDFGELFVQPPNGPANRATFADTPIALVQSDCLCTCGRPAVGVANRRILRERVGSTDEYDGLGGDSHGGSPHGR